MNFLPTRDKNKKSAKEQIEQQAIEEIEKANNLVKKSSNKLAAASDKKISLLFSPEDDDFYVKWSGPIILGGFLPFVFALIIIFSGQIAVNSFSGTCGFAIDTFCSLAVAVCYLYIILYSWIYIGDTIKVRIPLTQVYVTVCRPFQSIRWLISYYVLIGFVSFLIWIIGSVLLDQAAICATTAPALYNYTLFLVVLYWLGFCITMLYIVKLFYGDVISAAVMEQVRAPTIGELEDRIFRKSFLKFDRLREEKISHNDVPKLLQTLGVYVPESDLPGLLKQLDPEETGEVGYGVMFQWFKGLNAMADDVANPVVGQPDALDAPLRGVDAHNAMHTVGDRDVSNNEKLDQ